MSRSKSLLRKLSALLALVNVFSTGSNAMKNDLMEHKRGRNNDDIQKASLERNSILNEKSNQIINYKIGSCLTPEEYKLVARALFTKRPTRKATKEGELRDALKLGMFDTFIRNHFSKEFADLGLGEMQKDEVIVKLKELDNDNVLRSRRLKLKLSTQEDGKLGYSDHDIAEYLASDPTMKNQKKSNLQKLLIRHLAYSFTDYIMQNWIRQKQMSDRCFGRGAAYPKEYWTNYIRTNLYQNMVPQFVEILETGKGKLYRNFKGKIGIKKSFGSEYSYTVFDKRSEKTSSIWKIQQVSCINCRLPKVSCINCRLPIFSTDIFDTDFSEPCRIYDINVVFPTRVSDFGRLNRLLTRDKELDLISKASDEDLETCSLFWYGF